ncbi:hypothetical protein HPB47_002429 [Ixodes persulcatus]|uniref:Uncharacterized protein n=1 Tax=Ixodes persulcatus TaxID=34615 RepID=A0AC60PMF6_IXOPE|nr:hypothetical protein HPB47_002429 [Ixodes persulcatus]
MLGVAPSVLLAKLADSDNTSSSDDDEGRVYEAKFAELFDAPCTVPKVAVYLQESGKEKKVICGGALISPKYTITTAQCVSDSRGTTRPVGLFSVRLGDVDLRSTDGDTHAIDVDVETIHIHPRYNGSTYSNNVALLELSKEVPFGQFVRPVCLPLGEISMKNLSGIQAFVVGWEYSPYGERSRDLLQVGHVTIWEDADCQEVFRSFVIDQKTQLCAGDHRGGPGPCPLSEIQLDMLSCSDSMGLVSYAGTPVGKCGKSPDEDSSSSSESHDKEWRLQCKECSEHG